MELTDERAGGEPQRFEFGAMLRDEQARAVDAVIEHEHGVLIAPPREGKTVVRASSASGPGAAGGLTVRSAQLSGAAINSEPFAAGWSITRWFCRRVLRQ
jgi:hypothetical protein